MSAPQPGDRDRELSDFLFRLAHDIRSPLRAIRAHAELIVKEQRASADPRLGFIVSGAQNIELLANGLSSYAAALRIEQATFQPVQTSVLLRLALAKLRAEIQKCSAEITYDPLPAVAGNPDQLARLFENLVENALRHGKAEAARLQVSAVRQQEEWIFSIRDNGIGIEPAYLERIFQPFERLRGKESAGPGLGLTIAREIVRKHGGRIWAESLAGAGSTFFFTLRALS
ncbi:MAG TPA: ATP-binding protein [Bryobacteraceae bacterium]|nr:ATP-binding protein [Bryobacteraceae bacterium]